MNKSLAFFNCVSTKKLATEQTLKNIREFYPDAYIMLACDACESYMDLCENYNCEYFHSQTRLGYPTQPYGYSIDGAIDWITRFYLAALRCNSDYIIMFEDDIVITKPNITLPDANCFLSCSSIIEGVTWIDEKLLIPNSILDLIGQISGKRPITNYYAGGGGSIFEVKMIIENYHKMVHFLRVYGTEIIKIYPYLCWIDCFMTIYVLLSGYKFQNNTKLVNLYDINREITPDELKGNIRFVSGLNWDKILEELKDDFEILTHYKKYY